MWLRGTGFVVAEGIAIDGDVPSANPMPRKPSIYVQHGNTRTLPTTTAAAAATNNSVDGQCPT